MKEELLELLNKAYAPYSNFRVSAIVVMKDGKKFSGVNVENASYGACICAERNAITTAITNGYTVNDFDKLYVMTSGERVSSCCFLCRQSIVEFFEPDRDIILMSKYGEEKIFKVKDLCPYPFTSEDL